MIVTELYNGQGLGNQLWTYIVTRVIAIDKGYDFGIKSPEKFKGKSFLNIDFGKKVTGGSGPEGGPPRKLPDGIPYYYAERKFRHPPSGSDIRVFDKNLTSISDGTMIDGYMQDEQYIAHRKTEIKQWLKVSKKYNCRDFSSENICVINFRGGAYVNDHDFFLPKQYWDDAISHMRKTNPKFKFIVVTDDVHTARKFFPRFPVHHWNIGKDFAVIKNAKYLILSNSSFAWFPAWISDDLKFCIAPKYWGRYNISDGYWSLGYNMTKGFTYMDKKGMLYDYDSCMKEFSDYVKKHPQYFACPKKSDTLMIVSNFNNDIKWLPELSTNYMVYDQSNKADAIPATVDTLRVKKSPHTGHNISDYISYILENYDNLPSRVMFTKGNVFPRYVSRDYFERIMNNEYFTPIEEWELHDPRWPKGMIASDGGFCEQNNSLYLRGKHPLKYFNDYNDFLRYVYSNPVIPQYVRFAPGAMYIVPKEQILKLPKMLYQNLMEIVTHNFFPGEAFIVERALHTLWSSTFEFNPLSLKPLDKNMTYIIAESDKSKLAKKITPVFLRKLIPRALKEKVIKRLR